MLSFLSNSVEVIAAQEPVMRVLVMEASRLRFRSDSRYPLQIQGPGSKSWRVRSANILHRPGSFKTSIEGPLGRVFSLGVNNELRIRSDNPRGIWLGKRRYRGELRVHIRENKLEVVNHLGIETYLKSVVGSEMPKAWPIEALKAQAVAARTYALQQLPKVGNYDIESSQSSQVYLGVEAETNSTRRAVDTTRSLVLTHDGKLINAVFHSSSGGVTEASGAVWSKQLPYLVSVQDHDSHSPVHKWEVIFTPDQLKKAFHEVNGVNHVEVLRATATGRVSMARVYGPSGQLVLSGRDVRSRLGLKSTQVNFEMTDQGPPKSSFLASIFSSPPKLSHFKSFYGGSDQVFVLNGQGLRSNKDEWLAEMISKNPPSTPPPTTSPPSPDKKGQQLFLRVNGSGAGHGVGMSQWGAHGLAKRGSSFRQILNHYYRGVEILPYRQIKNSFVLPNKLNLPSPS